MKIAQKIEEIVEKYVISNSGGDYYAEVRYDKDADDFYMIEEIRNFFVSLNIPFKIKKEEGCSLYKYDNDFLAIAWIENNELHLKTVLLECYG